MPKLLNGFCMCRLLDKLSNPYSWQSDINMISYLAGQKVELASQYSFILLVAGWYNIEGEFKE